MKIKKSAKTGKAIFYPLWASKSVSVAMGGMLIIQFTYYATEYVGLSPAIVGIILLLSRLLDAVAGIAVGFLVDRTNTRFGKGRAYDLLLIPMWVSMVFLFSAPDFGMTGKVIYLWALFTLTSTVFMSLLGGGEAAYLSRAVHDNMQRAKVTSITGVLVMLLCSIGGALLPQLMATLGMQTGGWQKIALIYAVPMSLIGMIRFLAIKEKPFAYESSVTDNQKIGLKEGAKLVLRNRYIFILAFAGLFCNLTVTLVTTIATYYFTYIIGNLGLMSFISMIGLLTPLLFLIFPIAVRSIGGMNFIRIGLVLAALGNLIKLIDITNIPLLVTGQLLANGGTSALLMMQGYFILQIIDYGERKTGKRIDGLSSAVCALHGKIGAGLASVLIGIVLGAAGYMSLVHEQSERVMNVIVSLYTWIPAVLCVLILITINFYDLEKKIKKG